MRDPGQNQLIATNVRCWLHYDTLASSLYKQAIRAREERDKFEKQVIDGLVASSSGQLPIIQINGGVVRVVDERTPRTLTVSGIRQMLHMYFQQKGSGTKDETDDIMGFISRHRGYTSAKHLRKSGGISAPPLPPPPGSGQIVAMGGGGGGGIGH